MSRSRPSPISPALREVPTPVDIRTLALPCAHYARGDCRSCTLLEVAVAQQLAGKLAACKALLDRYVDVAWLPTFSGPTAGFRNKAKMALAGSIDAPSLGLADAAGHHTDLRDCPLYPLDMQHALDEIAAFITLARIPPYDIPHHQGELKFVLLTRAAGSGEMLLRFVLRSREALARIRKHLPELQRRLPALRVVSANLQPVHQAVLEGDTEILLSAPERLAVPINGVPLFLRPRCFWQTNDAVAAALYAQVRDWCSELDPATVWDLYCGVGGFALHCADGRRVITGIEVSRDAIACARDSAAFMSDARMRFIDGDATEFALASGTSPEMLVVNPPRRGLGARLCAWINDSSARWLVYSSCNATTLAADLARLTHWRVRRARLFDMFPHTPHCETLVLLDRRDDAST